MVRYMECQKNHAAHLGGHVLDGCGEFMPAGEEGTPLALKCAACECHRNFHRRESEVGSSTGPPPPLPQPSSTTPNNCYISFGNNTTTATKPTVIRPQPRAPLMMTFGGGGAAAESSSEDQAAMAAQFAEQYGVSKKRFRTKFTQEQKDKMMEFAERIEWRIQKQDESELQRFCQEIGIKRQVFKVWLHNNKQTSKKKHLSLVWFLLILWCCFLRRTLSGTFDTGRFIFHKTMEIILGRRFVASFLGRNSFRHLFSLVRNMHSLASVFCLVRTTFAWLQCI